MIPTIAPPGTKLLIVTLCLTLAVPAARTSRNPLDTIRADSCDERSPNIRTETAAPVTNQISPTHLANVHDGDYAVYRALDFDSGVAAFRATVAGPRAGILELHLGSPTGPLLVACPFKASGGWDQWQDITANVDNAQAGVRDVYILFRAPSGESPSPRALVNLRSFVFLKSVVTPSTGGPDLARRLDSPDDGEPQATRALIVPDSEYAEVFLDDTDWRRHWRNPGDLRVSKTGEGNEQAGADTSGKAPLFTYATDAYINKTDTGGEWRTLAEAGFFVRLTARDIHARPGAGFASGDGTQAVYVCLNPEENCLEVWRKLANTPPTLVHRQPQKPGAPLLHSLNPKAPVSVSKLLPGVAYDLSLWWSPYANALIADLTDGDASTVGATLHAVVDLPAARHPLLVNSGGPASFHHLHFGHSKDYTPMSFWEWYKQPVLTPDVCNPAIWRGPNGQMYMMWRRFGADTFHGIAKSDDGIHWTRVTDEAIRCTGDMTVLQDPFGDGKWYATPGGNGLPWWTSDGSDDFRHWTQTDKTIGDIHGHNRIQEIIDTAHYPQMKPVHFDGKDYRFIAYCENWVHAPQPHSIVLLSNTLTDWVQPSPDPVVPPAADFWGEKGNAIGSAFPLPDGNLLLCICACTNAGYTGAPEPTNVAAVASGAEPWKVFWQGTLPITPVSRENVWYQGPNFGTAFFYDDKADTLFLYGGFHDYHIGVMRLRHFMHLDPRVRD